LAEEGTGLPHVVRTTRQIATPPFDFEVEIYEEDRHIGSIVVENLPPDLPIGSDVEITLDFAPDFTIRGQAYVPAVGKEGTVEIKIEPMRVAEMEELKEQFWELREKHQEALEAAEPATRLTLGRRADRLIADIQKELDTQPERAKIARMLLKLETMLRELQAVQAWKPTREENVS
jgi:molecular chaperone DnaK (HSP70)